MTSNKAFRALREAHHLAVEKKHSGLSPEQGGSALVRFILDILTSPVRILHKRSAFFRLLLGCRTFFLSFILIIT